MSQNIFVHYRTPTSAAQKDPTQLCLLLLLCVFLASISPRSPFFVLSSMFGVWGNHFRGRGHDHPLGHVWWDRRWQEDWWRSWEKSIFVRLLLNVFRLNMGSERLGHFGWCSNLHYLLEECWMLWLCTTFTAISQEIPLYLKWILIWTEGKVGKTGNWPTGKRRYTVADRLKLVCPEGKLPRIWPNRTGSISIKLSGFRQSLSRWILPRYW